jgi:Mg-chelatase subunit ChlD
METENLKPEQKHQVHNLIVLDESSSMESIKKYIISGFNELVQTVKGVEKQFPEQEHYVSIISFNGLGIKKLHFMEPVRRMEMIDDEKYRPASMTPLWDALGFALHELHGKIRGLTRCNVLVTIMTDGEENASKEYSAKTIRELIEQRKSEGWMHTWHTAG